MKDVPKYVMCLRRIVFWPFTVMLGSVLHIRHGLYDLGILKRSRPTIPTIAIGNLALGGTGKTPMVELILRTLRDVRPIATLSRGYGRATRDVHQVGMDDPSSMSGDEPVQVKRKFPEVHVFVGADRVRAIRTIKDEYPDVKAVILDDALQHRGLDAGLNILLTTWGRPYSDDALFPAGTLRDLRERGRKAQLVVVTKCPELPKNELQNSWRERLKLKIEQQLFFAGIEYEEPVWVLPRSEAVPEGQDVGALLFTGIADPEPFLTHVRSRFGTVDHIAYPDHHRFSRSDLAALATRYANFAPGPNVLVTTEKDAARLRSVIVGSPLDRLPVLVIGMRAIILNEPERFKALIRDHVATHTAHR